MKKIIFFTILAFIFLIIAHNCLAVELLLDWPKIGADNQKLGAQSSVPDLIKYIYTFALAICGITALVSIVFGAAQYAFSAGDSSKMGDAKDRITQALLGIVILLFAVLILRTINPDLINLNLGSTGTTPPSPDTTGNYKCWCCCQIGGGENCDHAGDPATHGQLPWGLSTCKNLLTTQANSQCDNDCRLACLDRPGKVGYKQSIEKCP